ANSAYIAAANPQTVLALLDHLASEKARADAAEAKANEGDVYLVRAVELLSEQKATIASLTEQLAEAREAHDGWNPVATCPIREPVDLWCVYGGEEFAQYEGGASIGKLVPNRIK